jgi:membrane protein DedA with SNARE-associated domain
VQLIEYLKVLPLEWFVLVGSFLEELISPIPSFLVLMPAGAGLAAQGLPAWYMIVLALLGGFGRVLAALILYWLSGKLYSAAYARKTERFGVKRRTVEQFGKKLRGRRTWLAIFSMWAIPIFPGAPISLASGFVKVPIPVFISATFWGSVVNAGFYLYAGYLGLNILESAHALNSFGKILALIALITLLAWLLRRRMKGVHS